MMNSTMPLAANYHKMMPFAPTGGTQPHQGHYQLTSPFMHQLPPYFQTEQAYQGIEPIINPNGAIYHPNYVRPRQTQNHKNVAHFEFYPEKHRVNCPTLTFEAQTQTSVKLNDYQS